MDGGTRPPYTNLNENDSLRLSRLWGDESPPIPVDPDKLGSTGHSITDTLPARLHGKRGLHPLFGFPQPLRCLSGIKKILYTQANLIAAPNWNGIRTRRNNLPFADRPALGLKIPTALMTNTSRETGLISR